MWKTDKLNSILNIQLKCKKKRFKGNIGDCETLSIGVNLCDIVLIKDLVDLTSK